MLVSCPSQIYPCLQIPSCPSPDLPLLTDPISPPLDLPLLTDNLKLCWYHAHPRSTLAYRSSYAVLVSCPPLDLPLLTDHLMLYWYHVIDSHVHQPIPRPTLAYRSSYAMLVSCPPPDLPLLTDHLMLCWYHVTDASNSQAHHAHPQIYPCLPIILCCAGIMSLTHTLIMLTPRPTLAYRSSYVVLVSCH